MFLVILTSNAANFLSDHFLDIVIVDHLFQILQLFVPNNLFSINFLYICNFTNCSSRQIVYKLLFRTLYLQTVVVDLLFANCHSGQLFWQIIILDNFLANCHSGQFFLQIIDLNNFLLRMVIVNCFFLQIVFPVVSI